MERPPGFRRISAYDRAAYPFTTSVQELFGPAALGTLHERYPMPAGALGDQDTPAHDVFYCGYSRVQEIYERFVRDAIAPAYDEDLCVQRIPTFRVHYPGAVAVKAFHCDSDYNHQVGTVNYWLPLTPAFSTNTIWVETEPESGEFRPVDMVPGQVLCFDAVRLRHGNHSNDTPVTRVSVDFRVLPLREYRDSGLASVARGVPLRLNGYYMLLTREGEFRHRAGDGS